MVGQFGVFNALNQGAVNKQQLGFNKQLTAGVKSGELNEKEFMNLANYDQQTRQMEGGFLKDGTLSFKERETLEERNKQNKEMLDLYKRGEYEPELQKPQNGIESRMQNQLRSTFRGIEKGNLTYGEGVKLLNRQGETATNYGQAKATPNGFWNTLIGKKTFTDGEKEGIHKQLNKNGELIHDMKKNWASDWNEPQEADRQKNVYNWEQRDDNTWKRTPVRHHHDVSQQNPLNMYGGEGMEMPSFQGGETPSYMSDFTQGMFSGMQQQQMMQQMMMMMMMMSPMMMMMMMMQSGGQQMGMPNGMQQFMGIGQNFPLQMNSSFDMGQMGQIGPQPYNAVTGNRIADTAMRWNGAHFKPGETKRCADFVSTMIEQSGQAPRGFKHQMSAAGLRQYGTPVGDMKNLKPGDVVFFGNTYRPGNTTHTGIYLGNGKFAHRPTANKPVKIDNMNSPYWKSHYTGGNRLGIS